jgi:hypothetical protein
LELSRGLNFSQADASNSREERPLRAFIFLFKGPLILLMLFVINLMTSPGHWWVQWAALGIGIAWILSLIRVVKAVALAGGLAALGIYLSKRA